MTRLPSDLAVAVLASLGGTADRAAVEERLAAHGRRLDPAWPAYAVGLALVAGKVVEHDDGRLEVAA